MCFKHSDCCSWEFLQDCEPKSFHNTHIWVDNGNVTLFEKETKENWIYSFLVSTNKTYTDCVFIK